MDNSRRDWTRQKRMENGEEEQISGCGGSGAEGTIPAVGEVDKCKEQQGANPSDVGLLERVCLLQPLC
jgi:hypothetical protein